MADGTNVYEPIDGDERVTTIDSKEIDFGLGSKRDRQRVSLAGSQPNDEVAVRDEPPSDEDYGLVVRPTPDSSIRVSNLGDITPPPNQLDGLTDAELRATPVDVEVSGEVNAQLWIDGQLVSAENPLTTTARLTDNLGLPYTTTNPLPVDLAGNVQIDNLTVAFESRVSLVNSRSTPLAANETFVGEWEDVVNFAAISASVFTDQWSTVNGAVAQFSADGIDVLDATAATIPPNQSAHFSFSPKARYFRIVYTNGPVAQSVLEVEVTMRFSAMTSTQLALDAPSYGNYVADLTKAALQGRLDGPGIYAPIRATDANELRVNDEVNSEYLSNRYGGGKQSFAGVVGASGDTTVITPAVGKRVKVFWVYAIADPSSPNSPLVTVKLGTQNIYAGFAISHWEVFTGEVDAPVVINLSSATDTAITIHYAEV